MTASMAVEFILNTAPHNGHPHPEYTHRCDVTLFGEHVYSLWGKSAEQAEHNARCEIRSRFIGLLPGRARKPLAAALSTEDNGQ